MSFAISINAYKDVNMLRTHASIYSLYLNRHSIAPAGMIRRIVSSFHVIAVA